MPSAAWHTLTVAALVVSTFCAMMPGLESALAETGASSVQRGVSATGRYDLAGKSFDAVVARVADGDTLDAVPIGESRAIRIRLEGIDAPEQGEAFGREAMALVRRLLFDQRVRVHGRELDRYGRLVARVVRGDVDASVYLVRAGLACHAYAYDAALAREETAARQAGAGFWAPSVRKPACVTTTAFSAAARPPPPGGTSQRRQEDGTGVPPVTASTSFRGNTTSRVYHAPHCPNYTCRNCTQVFASEAEAKAAGFRPASDCLKR
jgi:micrococcal nuclease